VTRGVVQYGPLDMADLRQLLDHLLGPENAELFIVIIQDGVPGVISGKFSVRKIATKSPSVARRDPI
jgi:hypothetical protein